MDEFVKSAATNGDVRHLQSLTFVEAIQKLFDAEDDNPILSDCIQGLNSLRLILDTTGRSPCNASRYSALVKAVKCQIVGLGDQLRAQQLCMNCASIGLYLPIDFMAFFDTGCSQQLKNLKMPPFFFERADQVVQLRKHLMQRRPELLPVQADEMIRTLSRANPMAPSTDGVFPNHSPFIAKRDFGGRIVLLRFCCRRKRIEKAPTIAFNYGLKRNHYIPQWASSDSS